MLSLNSNGGRTCQHCGTPVPLSRADTFCCAGCAYVYELLHEQGMEQFYALRGGQKLPPVPVQALRPLDYEWLHIAAQTAEVQAGTAGAAAALELSVQGLSCVGCVWLLEKVFSRHPGALEFRADVVRGEVCFSWQPGGFDPVVFARELQSFGYLLGPHRPGAAAALPSNDLTRRLGLCGAFAMNAMAFSLPAYFGMPGDFMFARWFDLVAAASATLAMLVGGSYFIEKAWKSLRAGVLHIDTPIALGVSAAYAGSVGGWLAGVESLKYFDFVAVFIFLMLAGRRAQQAAVDRNRRRLMRDTSIPETLTLADGSVLAVGDLQPGMRFRIKPGQTVPVAARLLGGQAAVSLEWINGESEAVRCEEGQLLPSGALNIGTRALEAEALESWKTSILHRLLDARRPGEQRDLRLERLLRWYLLVVVLVGVGGGLWWWGSGAGLAQALQVMISIFVVSCPCALGVAVPLAEDLAVARAEKLGVFVRNLGLWKRLLRARRVIFDKTGTLTLENPVLENPEALGALDGAARAALRTLVTGNLHPVSRSLFDALGPGAARAGGEVREVIGQGLSFIDEAGIEWSLERGRQADAVLRRDGAEAAAFRFRDALRPESVDEVRALKQRGLVVQVLSGDRPEKVARIASQLGLDDGDWRAAMTPEQKADWVARSAEPPQPPCPDTLYIGDGANDSLAFDAALCAGSPVTGRSFLECKADFFFLGHSLRFVSSLLAVAETHRRATRRVFAFSVTYNIATVIVGLLGHLNPLAAAVLMPLSSVATLALVAVTFHSRRTPSEVVSERSPAMDAPLTLASTEV